MTKIVYLVASHTNPEQVVRLVKALKTGMCSSIVIIHHDYSKSFLDPKAFEGLSDVLIIDNYVPVEWGNFSMVRMKLHILELLTHLEFDWIVFLSGQDYPIQPLTQIEDFLETTSYDGFMSGVPIENGIPCGPVECAKLNSTNQYCSDCMARYYYRYYETPRQLDWDNLPKRLRQAFNRLQKYLVKAQALIYIRSFPFAKDKPKKMIGFRSLWKPFPADFKFYKGSQWFTLNRACIHYIHQYVQSHPQFVKYYERTLFSEESFFQTILLNQTTLKILNDNKRLIRWPNAKSSSPDILKKQDFDYLIASDHHFARKFDINIDGEILNMLDEHVLSGSKSDKVPDSCVF